MYYIVYNICAPNLGLGITEFPLSFRKESKADIEGASREYDEAMPRRNK